MIWEPVFEGVKLGLLLSMMIGPVFFALMTTSLTHGFQQSAILALGVLVSDLIYVLITYLGVHLLTQIPTIEKYLGLVGGVILLFFGISFMFKKVSPIAGDQVIAKPKKRKAFFQGFGINGINPFVMLFWLSIASMVSIKNVWGISERTLFYSTLLLTIFGVDLLKAFLAGRLRPFLSPKFKRGIQIFAGALVCYFGIKMLWGSLYPVL
jgi:threonine/homoserine/homoserine lactone efflux protein